MHVVPILFRVILAACDQNRIPRGIKSLPLRMAAGLGVARTSKATANSTHPQSQLRRPVATNVAIVSQPRRLSIFFLFLQPHLRQPPTHKVYRYILQTVIPTQTTNTNREQIIGDYKNRDCYLTRVCEKSLPTNFLSNSKIDCFRIRNIFKIRLLVFLRLINFNNRS